MRAFRYIDGVLSPCEDMTERFRELAYPVAPLLYSLRGPPRDRRERRRWARAGLRGRRGARPVMAPEPCARLKPVILATRTMVRHRFQASDGRGAALYLPEGEEPTDAHCRDLDRVTRREP